MYIQQYFFSIRPRRYLQTVHFLVRAFFFPPTYIFNLKTGNTSPPVKVSPDTILDRESSRICFYDNYSQLYPGLHYQKYITFQTGKTCLSSEVLLQGKKSETPVLIRRVMCQIIKKDCGGNRPNETTLHTPSNTQTSTLLTNTGHIV
jgi:hypothetical protein